MSEATVSRYMPRRRKPPSQTWRTFLENHVGDLASVDFFVVPTATFRLLYVFVVLTNARRSVVHFNVTDSRRHAVMQSKREVRVLRKDNDVDEQLTAYEVPARFARDPARLITFRLERLD